MEPATETNETDPTMEELKAAWQQANDNVVATKLAASDALRIALDARETGRKMDEMHQAAEEEVVQARYAYLAAVEKSFG